MDQAAFLCLVRSFSASLRFPPFRRPVVLTAAPPVDWRLAIANLWFFDILLLARWLDDFTAGAQRSSSCQSHATLHPRDIAGSAIASSPYRLHRRIAARQRDLIAPEISIPPRTRSHADISFQRNDRATSHQSFFAVPPPFSVCALPLSSLPLTSLTLRLFTAATWWLWRTMFSSMTLLQYYYSLCVDNHDELGVAERIFIRLPMLVSWLPGEAASTSFVVNLSGVSALCADIIFPRALQSKSGRRRATHGSKKVCHRRRSAHHALLHHPAFVILIASLPVPLPAMSISTLLCAGLVPGLFHRLCFSCVPANNVGARYMQSPAR